MKVKAIQTFSKQYLEDCKKMSPEDILVFLDEFRKLYGSQNPHAKQRKPFNKVEK